MLFPTYFYPSFLKALSHLDVLLPYPERYILGLAENIIGKKDPKDIPFIAAALAFTVDGIWSNDRDFESQSICKM